MTEPYYTDGQVTLYLGDCREITDWLTADILVVDPPYGRDWRQGELPCRGRRAPSKSRRGIPNDTDTSVRDDVLRLWGPDRVAIVFGDLMLAPPPGVKLTGVYQKPPDAGARGTFAGFRRDLEAVYFLGPWAAGVGGRSSLLRTAARVQGSDHGIAARAGHPHAKPLDVMHDLLTACPPGTIADPCAGSGSTLLAARDLGRPAVGVEIEERWASQAARRLSQGVLDLEPDGDAA